MNQWGKRWKEHSEGMEPKPNSGLKDMSSPGDGSKQFALTIGRP